MDALKAKATSIVTGDAHKKPAKTKDGAFTTQDSADAHTLEGTSAKDDSIPSTGVKKDVDAAVDNVANQRSVPKSTNTEVDTSINKGL